MANPHRPGRSAWIRLGTFVGMFACTLAFVPGFAGAAQRASVGQGREVPVAPCRGGDALLGLGRLKAAEAAYEKALGTGATVRCAREGLANIGHEHPCAAAKALLRSGEKAEAKKAYLESIAAKPAKECASTGIEESSTQSWLDRVKSASGDVLTLLGGLLLSVAVLGVAVLLLIRLQSVVPWFKDRWPVRVIRQATVTVEKFDDSAFDSKFGAATAALVKKWIEVDSRRHYLKLVSGASATEETWLSKAAEVGQEGKIAAAIIGFCFLLLPTRHVRVTGELQPATVSGGPGISVELHSKVASKGMAVLWADRFSLPVDAGVATDTVRKLVVPTGAWISHRFTSETGGRVQVASDPMSWALFKAGVEWQRDVKMEKAKELYLAAMDMDSENYGARANLAVLRARDGHYRKAIELLVEAREILGRMEDYLANPDWYRVSYSIAAEYTNWALNGHSKAKRARLKRATECSEAVYGAIWATLGQRKWGLEAMCKERQDLLVFLRGQVKPSLDVLAAGIQLSESELASSNRDVNFVRATVANFVASSDHSSEVEYNLACLYAQTGMPKLASRHLELAFAKTSSSDRLLLAWRVTHDSTLDSVRKKFLKRHPREATALTSRGASPPSRGSWV